MVQARSDGGLDGDDWGRLRQMEVSVLETKLIGLACLLCACMHAKSLSRVRLCNPMDRVPPGSSVSGILQARKLEWVVISFSRASSWPRD